MARPIPVLDYPDKSIIPSFRYIYVLCPIYFELR